MGIYSKLLEIQRSVRALLPNADGNNYKYISGSKVLGIVRPKMDELGVILKTEVLDITNTRQDYTVGRDQRPKSEILSSVKMRFTWIDVESGEKDECEWSANGQNDWDKGVGFILKYFHIATDEDDVDRLPRHDDAGPASKPTLTDEMLTLDLFEEIIKAKEDAKGANKRFSLIGFLESKYIVDKEMLTKVNVKVTEYYNLTRENKA